MEIKKTYHCFLDNKIIASYDSMLETLNINEDVLDTDHAQALFEFLRELANEGVLEL